MKKKKKIKKYVRRSFWFYFRKFLAVIAAILTIFSINKYNFFTERHMAEFPNDFNNYTRNYKFIESNLPFNPLRYYWQPLTDINSFNTYKQWSVGGYPLKDYFRIKETVNDKERFLTYFNRQLQLMSMTASGYNAFPNTSYMMIIDRTVYNKEKLKYEWENILTTTSESTNYIEVKKNGINKVYKCMTQVSSDYSQYSKFNGRTTMGALKDIYCPQGEYIEYEIDDIYVLDDKVWLGHYKATKTINSRFSKPYEITEEFDDTPENADKCEHIYIDDNTSFLLETYEHFDTQYTLTFLNDKLTEAQNRLNCVEDVDTSSLSSLTENFIERYIDEDSDYLGENADIIIIPDENDDYKKCLLYSDSFDVEGPEVHTVKKTYYDYENDTVTEKEKYVKEKNQYKVTLFAVGEYDKKAFWNDGYWKLEIIYWNIIIALPLILISVFISVYLNSNNRKKYYMQEENEYRKTLTNTLAHDLKTPLTAMRGYAENLIESTNPEKSEYYMNKILSNTEYMNKIIHDILELSKSEMNNSLTNITIIDLAEILKEKLNENEDEFSAKGIRLNISDCSFIAQANETMINQIAVNLTENILKYTKDNGQVWLETGSKSLILKNTCASDIKHGNELLEPFVKGDESRTNQMGSGLGLSLVHNLAEKNNLKINVSADDGIFVVEILEKHN